LKPLDAFYKMKGMRDGHRNECKACGEDTFRLMAAAAYLSGWETAVRPQRVRLVIGG
jgi:hypothetical protein